MLYFSGESLDNFTVESALLGFATLFLICVGVICARKFFKKSREHTNAGRTEHTTVGRTEDTNVGQTELI